MKTFYLLSLLLMSTAMYAGTRIIEEDDTNEYSQRNYLLSEKIKEEFYRTKLARSLFNTELPESTELDNAIMFSSREEVQRLLDKGTDPFTLNYNHRSSSSKKEIANFALVEKVQRNYCKMLLLCLKKKCPKMPKEMRESLLIEYVQENSEPIRALLHSDDYPLLHYQDKSASDIAIPFYLLYPVVIDDID